MSRLPLAVPALLVCLAACSGKAGPEGTTPPAPSPPAEPAPTTEPGDDGGEAVPGDARGGSVTVKNPLGMELQGTKHVDPAPGTVEHTLIGALQHQAGSGDFQGFLAFIHPAKKTEEDQLANLEAYTWTHSKGGKAAACLHDGALITVGEPKVVEATIEGGGSVGQKIMVWCGADRMPVPFTLYPDGDVQKITVFGLN